MIEIGRIVKPQGIKGEVKVLPDCEKNRLANLSRVFISEKEFKVDSISIRDAVYLKLNGVDDRNEAELLRGEAVFAPKEELVPLKDNEFYFQDLIGSKVLDENNIEIGVIEDIEQYGAADVIVIRERNMLFSVPFLDSIFIKIGNGNVNVLKEEYDNLKING